MKNEQVYAMKLSKVYPMLLSKAVRKGRTEEEVHAVTCWLTGYAPQQLAQLMTTDLSYGDFFRNAPLLHPNRMLITGSICGVRVESIEESPMREIRCLDKMVDELAKGKPMEKILR